MRGMPGILLSAILLWAPVNRGQSQTATAPRVPSFATTLSKAVVRITETVEGVTSHMDATGFLVGIPDARLPHPNDVFTYLVTNRHVAEAIFPNADGVPMPHKVLTMEAIVNLKEPVNGTRAHSISLPPRKGAKWFLPKDASIDLAVIAIPLSQTYDVIEIEPGFFLTSDVWDKYRIGPGDKLLTCGYFLHYAGVHQFQPIVREGSLAMVPDDTMPVPIGGSAKVYLADLHIIPGNSGSPLFLAPASTLGGLVTDSNGDIPYGLLGVVSGYMWEDDKLTLRATTDYEGTIHANSGIAMIVPVDQLKDLLYSAEAQTQRDSLFANKAAAP